MRPLIIWYFLVWVSGLLLTELTTVGERTGVGLLKWDHQLLRPRPILIIFNPQTDHCFLRGGGGRSSPGPLPHPPWLHQHLSLREESVPGLVIPLQHGPDPRLPQVPPHVRSLGHHHLKPTRWSGQVHDGLVFVPHWILDVGDCNEHALLPTNRGEDIIVPWVAIWSVYFQEEMGGQEVVSPVNCPTYPTATETTGDRASYI